MQIVVLLSRWVGVLMVAAAMTGCAVNRASASVDPSANLSGFKAIHVVKLESDDRNVYRDIADKLRVKGFVVTTGEAKPANVDATVTYFDKWQWDITMYLLQLTVVVRDPKTDFPLATGESLHTSLTRKSQKEMVDEVIDNIFRKGT